jgi:hypothetical protein
VLEVRVIEALRAPALRALVFLGSRSRLFDMRQGSQRHSVPWSACGTYSYIGT